MTDSLKITSNVKRIAINDDPARIITFNPTDVAFAERFYAVVREFDARQADYERRAEAIDAVQETDADGLPVNLADRIDLMREICEFAHAKIDDLFGVGTALKVFEGMLDVDMITQFFEGITPFFTAARRSKVERYRGKGKRTLK